MPRGIPNAPNDQDYTLPDTPGPEADAQLLKFHRIRVQTFFATHAYDVFKWLCHWCLKDEQVFSRDIGKDKVFCSERCRDASAKCYSVMYNR